MQYADELISFEVPSRFAAQRYKDHMSWDVTRDEWLIGINVMSQADGWVLEDDIRRAALVDDPDWDISEMRELKLGDSVAIYRESVRLVRGEFFSKQTQMAIPHRDFLVFLTFSHDSDFDVAKDFIGFLHSIKVNGDAVEFDTDDEEEDWSRFDETKGILTGDLYDDTIVRFKVPEGLELDDASREIGRYFLTREDLTIELTPLGDEPPDTFDETTEDLRLGTAGDDCYEIVAGENSGVASRMPETEQEDGTYYEYYITLKAGGEFFMIQISDRHLIALDDYHQFFASIAPWRSEGGQATLPEHQGPE